MPKKTTRVGLRLVKPTPRRAHPGRTGLDWVQKVIKLENIGPSPYQRRRYFDEDKLKELAASIQREGLIEPIVARPVRKRYELIAGERRLRAIRDYTELETIQTQIAKYRTKKLDRIDRMNKIIFILNSCSSLIFNPQITQITQIFVSYWVSHSVKILQVINFIDELDSFKIYPVYPVKKMSCT